MKYIIHNTDEVKVLLILNTAPNLSKWERKSKQLGVYMQPVTILQISFMLPDLKSLILYSGFNVVGSHTSC